MKILLVSPYFPPLNRVGALRLYAFARDWAEAGESVTVLTTAKRSDQQGLDVPYDGFSVKEIENPTPRWLDALRRALQEWQRRWGRNGCGASTGHRPASWQAALEAMRQRSGVFSSVRMPDLTDYWVKPAIRWVRENGPWDVVVSSSGPYTAHVVGMEAKTRGQAGVWVADFRDLWVENPYSGLFPFTLREQWIERRCLQQADVVTTVSEGLRVALSRKAKRVEIVYNGFRPEDYGSLPEEGVFPDDQQVRLVYTGTLYRQQDPQPLLHAIRNLREHHPEVGRRLRIVVAGRCDRIWREHATRCGVEEALELRGEVRRDEALCMQRDASALLLLDWKGPQAGILTGKLFEYLASRPPVLVIGGGETSAVRRIVERAGRGLVLGDSSEPVASVLETLASGGSFDLARDDEYIRRFTRQNQSRRCLELLRESLASQVKTPAAPGVAAAAR